MDALTDLLAAPEPAPGPRPGLTLLFVGYALVDSARPRDASSASSGPAAAARAR